MKIIVFVCSKSLPAHSGRVYRDTVMKRGSRPLRLIVAASKRRQLAAQLARNVVFNMIKRTPSNAASKRIERILELLVNAEEIRMEVVQRGLKSLQTMEGAH